MEIESVFSDLAEILYDQDVPERSRAIVYVQLIENLKDVNLSVLRGVDPVLDDLLDHTSNVDDEGYITINVDEE